MRLVIIESPYAGEVEANIDYAKQCILDCLKRGEAPLASHLLYTQEGLLNDSQAAEREQGIKAGHAWIRVADAIILYTDRGISSGMQKARSAAANFKIPIEYRKLRDSIV